MNSSDKLLNFTKQDWDIPIWIKVLVTVFSLGCVGVFFRVQTLEQAVLLGLSREVIALLATFLFVVSAILAYVFWFYHESVLSRLLYWLLRVFRDHIRVLALLGIVYLFAIGAPPISMRGGILYLSLLVVFGIGFSVKHAGLGDIPHASLVPVYKFSRKVFAKVSSGPLFIWKIVAVLLPGAIMFFVIYIVLGSRLSNYGPYSFWNDETAYWVWLRSYVYAGFNSGYNSPNELLPMFEFSRFGEASPFYIYIYGGIARFVGWYTALSVLINLFFVSLSVLLFIRYIKLDVWQIISLCLVIMFCWPVLLYLPMTTHESLNQAFGIVFAIFFIKLTSHDDQIPWISRWLFVFLLYIATLVRLSWGLLLIPAIFYSFEGSYLKRSVISILLGCFLYVSAITLMGYLLPPLNNSILDAFRGGFSDGPRMLFDKVRQQLFFMFRFKELTPNVGVSFQMLLVIGWGVGQLFKMIRRKLPFASVVNHYRTFNLYNTTSLLLGGLVFYLQEGFYRIFAPAMLILYLMQIFHRDYRRLSVLLMINVLFFSSYMNFYAHTGDFQIIRADYTREEFPDSRTQAQIEKIIVYDPEEKNPWCNTLLIPLRYYNSNLMMFPPGIGISYIIQPSTFQLPIKSKYIWFDQETYQAYINDVNFEHLASFSTGELYLNVDADCPKVK